MASQEFDYDEQRVEGAPKQYGNSVLHDRASAHFGDVSHHLNISGGLHLHVQAPLEPLTISAVAVRAANICGQFQNLAANILSQKARHEELLSFENLSHDLASLEQNWREHSSSATNAATQNNTVCDIPCHFIALLLSLESNV